ncbi:MAG: glycoside hydrolase [Verrucomicrobia bacterium]|nr:glycoside hydrolase [Verrucomicrobiota bacterium]
MKKGLWFSFALTGFGLRQPSTALHRQHCDTKAAEGCRSPRRWRGFVALLYLLPTLVQAEADRWSLTSPNGRCEITVQLSSEGRLSYQVSRAGKVVLPSAPLGLALEGQNFESGLRCARAGKLKQLREKYELFAGVMPHVDRQLHQRTLEFSNTNSATLTIDLAASDEGVAFRYRLTGDSKEAQMVQAELAGFQLPMEARGWLQPYHAAGPYTPAYEDFYFHVAPGDAPPRSRGEPLGWCFPALFNVPGADSWVLLTESGTDGSYTACHLGSDSTGGLYRVAFPLPDEHTKGQSTNLTTNPRSTLPWIMPWRVIVLGANAGEIATSTLVTDLALPAQIKDTSWIKPGRASWAWWSYPDGPFNAEHFNQFTDFAAKMGWEYTLFDAGWWSPGLKQLAAHAKEKGVAPLAWLHAQDFYDAKKRARKLDEMVAAGICGVKVDFWCSDRQESIVAMHALFADAAERKLLVNLHGCTIPRGWHRTWPNFMTAEAVLGTESYFYEPRYSEKAAELNTVLPFTRNVVGPMDYTPLAISPKKYQRTTTAAHELATALIFTSGIIHYADQAKMFESLPPEALKIFHDAPARWDETHCLLGEPGRLAVFARRTGSSWFIAGINGSNQSQPVTLDLKRYRKFGKGVLIAEGKEAQMEVIASPLKPANEWQHTIPSRGGFILRLDK